MKKEREFKVVKEWKHKGKKCVIVLFKWSDEVKKVAPSISNDHYNGYVETSLDKHYDKIDAEVHGGLTFGVDDLKIVNVKGKFYGFDTAHYNDLGIKHRTLSYVTKECEKLAEQLIKLEE